MPSDQPTPDRRLRGCVERWPDAQTGGYDPRCCRFPKSCSATVYDEGVVAEQDLEPAEPTGCEDFILDEHFTGPVTIIQTPTQADVDAAYERGKADAEKRFASMIAEAVNVRVEGAHTPASVVSLPLVAGMLSAALRDARERGLREATEGPAYTDADERRVGDALEEYYRRMGAPPSMTRPYAAARMALDAATAGGRRLVGPWELADLPSRCPRIAHESGVVLACTVDHGQPRSGLHANVHHQVMWDEDDDRIITEPAGQPEPARNPRYGSLGTPEPYYEGGAEQDEDGTR